MRNRNCPNCGAPYDAQETKCPYCGTSYFDMSSIDMSATRPFFLRIRYGNQIIEQKVLPKAASFECSSDGVTCYGGLGNNLMAFSKNNSFETEISFVAVCSDSGSLATFHTEMNR